jgi:HEXXH motif-containing protein
MNTNDFMQFQRDAVVAGQQQLANAMRALLYKYEPDIFEIFSDAGDELFLEPLLFAYFAARDPVIKLPQILLGYLDEDMWPEETEVHADEAGRVYLPRIGYLLTEVRDRALALRWDEGSREFTLVDGDAPVPFELEEILYVPGTSIEIVRHPIPLLDDVLLESTPNASDFAVAEAQVAEHVDHIARALAMLRAEWPEYHADIEATLRQIVLFRSERLNSCASLSIHGVVLFNITDANPHDEVYFLDELAHQGGHVIFSAATVRRGDFLQIDPETPIGQLTGQVADDRSVYTVLHGAFTEYAMMQGMRRCLDGVVLLPRQAHEMLGRLAFISQKAAIDVANLATAGILTDRGRQLYEVFERSFQDMRREWPALFADYDFSSQPYNFSYELFARTHPMQATRDAAG